MILKTTNGNDRMKEGEGFGKSFGRSAGRTSEIEILPDRQPGPMGEGEGRGVFMPQGGGMESCYEIEGLGR